jgi:hypothetical protein
MERSLDRQPDVADLRRRYGGRIRADVSGAEAARMSVLANDLLREWNPIQASAADVRALMGTPTAEQAGVMEYVFDNGWGGGAWRFKLRNEIVVGVEWEPLD